MKNIGLYLRQAWRLLRENPVLSGIAVLGTALSICMIMVIVVVFRLQNVSMSPEGNRDRMLYVQWMTAQNKEDENSNSNGLMSYNFAKAAFKSLKTPEAVAVATRFSESVMVSAPGSKVGHSFDQIVTDEGYWKVFDHTFIAGHPYTQSDVESGLPVVVITEKVARDTFDSIDVIGRTLLLDYTEYTVVGVVRNVSSAFQYAYGQVWLPLTTQNQKYGRVFDDDDISGMFSVYILAHSADDFDEIRAEAEQKRQEYNAHTTKYDAVYRGQPDTHFVSLHRLAANAPADPKPYIISTLLTLCLVLLVPALNLSGITGSRMKKRRAELGVRRAYGATTGSIVLQVFWEGLLQSLIGGLIGLIACDLMLWGFREVLLTVAFMSDGDLTLDLLTLVDPVVFVVALLFCLILNVLSGILPAWMAARRPIVDSLQEI